MTVKKKRLNNGYKPKFWWDEECKRLFHNVIYTYNQYKNSGYLDEYLRICYNRAKKAFKIQKKFNIKLRRDKRLRRLNDLFKQNKNEFWRKVKILDRTKQTINIAISSLKTEYYKLFNDKNDTNSTDDYNDVDDFITKHMDQNYDYRMDTSIITSIIVGLPSNKSVGFNGISNEMI